jgi:hypothetical protein
VHFCQNKLLNVCIWLLCSFSQKTAPDLTLFLFSHIWGLDDLIVTRNLTVNEELIKTLLSVRYSARNLNQAAAAAATVFARNRGNAARGI